MRDINKMSPPDASATLLSSLFGRTPHSRRGRATTTTATADVNVVRLGMCLMLLMHSGRMEARRNSDHGASDGGRKATAHEPHTDVGGEVVHRQQIVGDSLSPFDHSNISRSPALPEMSLIIAASDDPFKEEDQPFARQSGSGNITFAFKNPSAEPPKFSTHQAVMTLESEYEKTTALPPIRSGHNPHSFKNKPHKRKSAYDQSTDDDDRPIPLGVCQIYTGQTCDFYLRNQSVFVPPHITIQILEERLKAAYGVIRESKDMNVNCRGYALPSLCYSILPICRTPEKTNHQYFANKANAEHYAKKSAAAKQKKNSARKAALMAASSTTTTATTVSTPSTSTAETPTIFFQGGVTPSMSTDAGFNMVTERDPSDPNRLRRRRRRRSFDVTIDSRTKHVRTNHFLHSLDDYAAAGATIGEQAAYHQTQFPPTRSSENLRRICRNECELLENELCQKEYAIAKRHPTIGQKLPLEDCYNLPDSSDCSKLGVAIDSNKDEKCYWEKGSRYRGTVAVSISGKPCLQWARLMMEIANFPELAGQNYCRNPGGTESGPWCFVDNNLGSLEKSIELCDIPHCSDQWVVFLIIGFAVVGSILITVVLAWCWKLCHRQTSMSNIQNINLPNVDKNIYGNSRLNSPIEMTSLLSNANNIPGMQQTSGGRNNSALRVTQYTLTDVRFVEELGEGAFGKVYKGELSQQSGDKIFVAVKALKENASAKTQADFKREIELISDLRHDNIVCILGVVLKEEPLCMLFEYMTHGDLHEFLIANSPNENKSLTQLQFLSISMQICEGMEYLSGHHYVHRDLAARNCLVGETLTVKISDFGLSRDIYSSDYYRVQSKSLLPVRWMPSESILYGKFTTESDVWSYGVVLWEIYSYGLQPYYGYSNQEVISMVRARQLLPCPEVCPTAVYTLMVECWHEQAVRRPSFPEIGHRLKIWYQAQKRSDQNENSSLCPSRKGSVFSVVSSNRPTTSITPSTSSHHLQLSGGGSNSNTLGREHQHPKDSPAPKEQRYGSNHHSLDREKIRQSHLQHHHHPTAAVAPVQPAAHQLAPQQLHNHHHHHHHRSLDRDSNSSKSNAGSGSSTSGGSHNNRNHFHGSNQGGTNMSRSRSSNNSLSNIASSAPNTCEDDETSSHHQPPPHQQRRTNFDACPGELESGLPTPAQSRSSSRAAMQRPPKDPSKSGHHHHHHHSHNNGELHRKKSLGPDEMTNGHRKLSAAGSMSSMHSEASATSYSNHRKLSETAHSASNRTISGPPMSGC